MQVALGFDSYCRRDGWCPVYVILSNEGADVEGELRVVASSASRGAQSGTYARQVLLPAQSRKAYFLYSSSAGSSRSHLTVQLLAGDDVLSSEQVRVAWLGEGDRLYGVVSSSPSALNFLSGVAPASGKAEVAQLSLEALPPDPLGWEGLDVLILNDVDTAALSGEQRRALETWVAHGGHLIVGGGAGAACTVAGVADPSTGSGHHLLPVTVGDSTGLTTGGTRSVDDLWALGEYLGAPIAPGPYPVAEVRLRVGETLVEQGDLVLWARRIYGAGTVDFLAFDAGLNPFTRWDDNARLWEVIVGAGTTDTQWFTVHSGYSAQEAIKAIPGLELPSTLQILAFMLVYTLLIGPVNYVILRKLDRRELAWLTIPALVVGFTACAYVTGFQIRGGMAIVHRLAVVHVPVWSGVEGEVEEGEGVATGRVSQLVGLFSPRRTTYDVWVAGAGVHEIPGDYYGGPARQTLHIVEETGGSTVTNLRVDVGGIQPFAAEGYADVPAIEADLRLVEDAMGGLRLKGTVRNGGLSLKDAVLIVGGDQQRLGDLEADEEASIALLLHSYVSPDTPERILGPGSYWGGDRVLHRRHQFLQALFPYDGPGLEPGAYLIGWVEEGVPLPIEVVGRPFSTVETALYVYDLPVAGLETGATVTIPPGFINRQVEETTGDVRTWPEGLEMGPASSVVFRFTIWSGMMVQQVDELVLDWNGRGYGSTSHPPTISIWNLESEDWEILDFGWGRHSIPNTGVYVNPSGAVLLKLETDAGWPTVVDSLTITIKGRR